MVPLLLTLCACYNCRSPRVGDPTVAPLHHLVGAWHRRKRVCCRSLHCGGHADRHDSARRCDSAVRSRSCTKSPGALRSSRRSGDLARSRLHGVERVVQHSHGRQLGVLGIHATRASLRHGLVAPVAVDRSSRDCLLVAETTPSCARRRTIAFVIQRNKVGALAGLDRWCFNPRSRTTASRPW